MEKMAETLPEADEQALQHFLSNTSWSYRDVMDHVAHDASEIFEGKSGTCLLVDESAFAKKGQHSAGVARQWNGRLGKVDNCQVGVFTSLSRGNDTTLIDGELFLPGEWCKDNKRCAKAKIPKEKRHYRTKLEMALEQIDRARGSGLYFEWVGADSLYGRDYRFAMTLDGWGETFVLDVPENYWIYENDPRPEVPTDPATGRRRKRYVSEEKPIKLRPWLNKQDQAEWRTRTIRKGAKGPIKCKVLHKKVWIWDGKSSKAYHWHLICRTNLEGKELKLSISNAPDATSTKKLVYRQSQRHFVERAFQDAKSELGLAQYQARSWEAWHRHASLVMMGLLFFLKEKTFVKEEWPFITVADLVLYFAMAIPDRKSSEDGLMEILERRNEKRRRAHARKYGNQPPSMGLLT
jgi:SRSO17 transposase